MSTYQETLAEHVRICILRLLSDIPDAEANNSILADQVQAFGLKTTRDFINLQLAWLNEQGLLRLRPVTGTLSIATLTSRGLDVGLGHAAVPGVKRRLPGD